MRNIRTIIFITGALLVWLGVNYYIGWHIAVFLQWTGIDNGFIFWPAFTIVTFSYLIGRAGGGTLGPLSRLLKVIGSYYFAVMEFAILLLIPADIAALILHAAGIPFRTIVQVEGTIVLALLIILLAWGIRNAWSPVIRSYEITVDKAAGSRKMLTIAVASDIHLGNIVGNRHLRRLLHQVEQINPDLILLPGDVIDDVLEPFVRNVMSDTLAKLKAPLGTYAVLGNHEYYGGHIAEYVERMNAIDIPVLQDERIMVDGSFYLAGRKDKTAESMEEGRLSVEKLLEGADRKFPILLMDHQPYQFQLAADAGVDLLLCGHTHRGQFAPNHWITRRLFELDWGYMRKAVMHVFVSSGFGSWGPPVRLASRSEVLKIVVHFKSAAI
ncbi:metallophosphoesterase [Paenibacillus beijingensis]|uniref:Phosphoesterase n=1 Tax=Paenibacillus beijingensis TaxID=1126833 RepID=A0A0D5NP24_9BACL|nr:metallophosphoesterase [Paenibacillus beijingensis]AJY77026.1 phosphoesterase [Paenibacillus beijingensis]